MTVQQMRNAILRVYDTESWKKKVANMYDDQIIAIYHDFRNRGILNQVVRKERPKTTNTMEGPGKYVSPECQQMTIFDFMKGDENEFTI